MTREEPRGYGSPDAETAEDDVGPYEFPATKYQRARTKSRTLQTDAESCQPLGRSTKILTQ